MLKNLIKRLKGNASELAGSALSADNDVVMEAMVSAMVLTAYADGICADEEVDAVNKLIQSSPQLREFHSEPARLFDRYCDLYEASPMMAKIDLMKNIDKIVGDAQNAPRVLISAIEVAFAESGDEEEVALSPKEELILSYIARKLDLRLGQFI